MENQNARPDTADEVSPEFKALVDSIIAAGHTFQSVLARLDARITGTPPGSGRDNLLQFRQQLVEKVKARNHD